MHNIDVWIARSAEHVIVFTRFFAQVYQEDRKIPPEKITIIPNWVEDDSECVERNQGKEIRQRFSFADEDFLVAYGGNIGVGAGVDTLVKASTLVDDVHILIAGGGSELSMCQELANRIAPNKIFFYSPWPKEETMALYQAADVLVIPTHGAQSITSIPSKLIRYMLSGRPIIAACLPETELCNLIEEAGCGWVISPDNPEALAHAIQEAKSVGVAERDRRGRAGREYALNNFTSDINLPKLISIMEKVRI
jgi:glycosyltransferase involved in cell wall biosynthesis